MKVFLNEFKDFISKGNIFDLAFGVIIGGAVSKMVTALVENILMPLIGVLLGGLDFSSLRFTVGQASITYGIFLQSVIDFLITAFCVFMIIKSLKKAQTLSKPEKKVEPIIPEKTETEKYLEEIRDLLKTNENI